MKFALQQLPNGDSQVVDATGKALGSGDADRPLLHILPKLIVPAEFLGKISMPRSGLQCDEITLEVKSSLDLQILPEGGVHIRQPYPNRRYFVGGSELIRNGWLVPLPLDATEFDIEFLWRLEGASLWKRIYQDDWTVQHLLHVKLHPGEGMTYSMDSSCWPRRKAAPLYYSPTTTLGFDEATDVDKEHRQIVREVDLVYQGGEMDRQVAGYFIEEKIDVPGIPLDKAWTIDAFQEEQLHEVKQTALLTQENEEHRRNGPIEMPSELFVEAITLAQKVSFDKDSEFVKSIAGVPGGMERHPAMKLLCEWWATARPEGEPFKPGTVMPLVRVRDDGEYWWGNHEIPNTQVRGFNEGGRDAARVGDQVLLLFQATQENATFGDSGMSCPLPSGAPGSTIGISKKEYLSGEWDEAWQCLEALVSFPHRFTAAWQYLNRTGAEYRKTQRLKVERPVELPEGFKKCPSCGQLPVVTEDPTSTGEDRFRLHCGDHTFFGGGTMEEIVREWEYDDFDWALEGPGD